MVRAAALTFVLSLLSLGASGECIWIRWTARHFLSQSTDVALTTGTSFVTATVTKVLSGRHLRPGDAIAIPQHGCCPGFAAAGEYYVAANCPSGANCQWRKAEIERITGVEEYLRERHVVTRAAINEKLGAWQQERLATDDFRRWLATAEVNDDDVDDGAPSLTAAVLDQVDYLLDFVKVAESCQPGDAAWLKDFGAKTLLDRFRRLPPQETTSAYEAWLDAHEGSKDEWKPDELGPELDAVLDRDPAWSRAESCYQQWLQKNWATR